MTLGKNSNGDDTREIRLASGVVFTQFRHDGKLAGVVGNDGSGHGAVACALVMIAHTRQILAACAAKRRDARLALRVIWPGRPKTCMGFSL